MDRRPLSSRTQLPIDSDLPRILQATKDHQVVLLTATPGAGKTTRIPPALLHEYKKILVIEPRRVACLSSAQRIAEENQFQVGDEVGYEVRFDRKTSSKTQITFMTDGLFLRKLHQDHGYDVIILDEFHERTWSYDLILGILKENLELGQNFKLVLMSATFSKEKMQEYFTKSQIKTCFVEVIGQVFPLQIEHSPAPQQLMITDQFFQKLNACLEKALQQNVNSILVFLPGSYEIDQADRWISQKFPRLLIQKLHGQLPLNEQKDVILFSGQQQRVILSTNIAESSLTIQNVDCVIDSGLQKISQYKPQSGLTQLSLEKISLFSAKQRAGRAARTKVGIAFQMWTRVDAKTFELETQPEILRSDLSEIMLFLFFFGIQNPENFYWLDQPDLIRMRTTIEQLKTRELINDQHQITDKGKRVLQFPFDFDKSILLIESEAQNLSHLGALLVSHLEGKTNNIPDPELKSDIWPLVQHGSLNPMQKRIYQQTLGLLNKTAEHPFTEDDLTLLLLKAWPHHLCRRRENDHEKAKHFSGLGAKLHKSSNAKNTEYLIAVVANENQNEIVIRAGHGVEKSEVLKELGHWITVDKRIEMNPDNLSFYTYQTRVVGKIEIDTQKSLAVFAEIKPQLEKDIANRFEFYIQTFLDKETQNEIVHFYQLTNWILKEFPKLSATNPHVQNALPLKTEQLIEIFKSSSLEKFSELLISSESSFQSLYEKNWWDYFEIYLQQEFAISSSKIQEMLKAFPRSLQTSRGHRRIQYLPEGPTVEARIQEFFGMKSHPSILKNSMPLRVILLGPHYRPVQTTSNLISFWKTSYPEIKKELKGQYPKHSWPDDPVNTIDVPPPHRRKPS